MLKLALVGNPNSGKSTLYNALIEKGYQRVGNWSGVTVELAKGRFLINNLPIEVIDLPGCYYFPNYNSSNNSISLDEQIASDYLSSNDADIILNVIDATNLSRHLYLTMQLIEQGLNVIVVLNMMDEAKQKGINIDVELLERYLGCSVVPVVAVKKQGISELKNCMFKVAQEIPSKSPQPPVSSAEERYKKIDAILKQVLQNKKLSSQQSLTEKLDNIVLNRFLGIPLFLLMMYCLFYFAINIGSFIQVYFDFMLKAVLVDGMKEILETYSLPAWFVQLMVYGVGQGLQITLSFIPVMAGLFLGLSFLETSGYMARAAFVMDKLMQWIGLPGKSFIPLIIGFGCNVPAVSATRVLENYRERILTILMSPFMSCSARFSIYALFASAFFPHNGQNMIFTLYLVGILIAFITGFALKNALLLQRSSPLVMELPSYRWPNLSTLFRMTWHRLKRFLLKAGALIILFCILLGSFGPMHHEGSLLSSIGKTLTPLFSPMGIEENNWPAVVGLMTGMLAKELVVGTLKALYLFEGTENILLQFGSNAQVFAYLLFILLYFPCVSVVAAMTKELNKRWAIFSVVWTTGIAYFVSVLFYQLATFTHHPIYSMGWIMGMVLISMLAFYKMRKWASLQINKRRDQMKKSIPTRIVIEQL